MKTNFLPQLQMDFSGGLGEDVSSSPMEPKTFEELFAGTGIEPTKDENGGVHYNFNATLKNEPMKLYTEEQVRKAIRVAGQLVWEDEEIFASLPSIELPSDEEIEQEAYYKVSDHTENPYASFKSGAKWMKEQILNQKNSNHQEVTSDTPSNYQRGWNAAQRGLLQNDAWGDTYTDNANNRPSHEELDEWIKGWKAYRHSNEIAKN